MSEEERKKEGELFKKYLEEEGVEQVEAVTPLSDYDIARKMLQLYKQQIVVLKEEKEQLREELKRMQEENISLQSKLQAYEIEAERDKLLDAAQGKVS